MLSETYQRVVAKKPEAAVDGLEFDTKTDAWFYDKISTIGIGAEAFFQDDVAESLIVAHWLTLLEEGDMLCRWKQGFQVCEYQCYDGVLDKGGIFQSSILALADYLERQQ